MTPSPEFCARQLSYVCGGESGDRRLGPLPWYLDSACVPGSPAASSDTRNMTTSTPVSDASVCQSSMPQHMHQKMRVWRIYTLVASQLHINNLFNARNTSCIHLMHLDFYKHGQ